MCGVSPRRAGPASAWQSAPECTTQRQSMGLQVLSLIRECGNSASTKVGTERFESAFSLRWTLAVRPIHNVGKCAEDFDGGWTPSKHGVSLEQRQEKAEPPVPGTPTQQRLQKSWGGAWEVGCLCLARDSSEALLALSRAPLAKGKMHAPTADMERLPSASLSMSMRGQCNAPSQHFRSGNPDPGLQGQKVSRIAQRRASREPSCREHS